MCDGLADGGVVLLRSRCIGDIVNRMVRTDADALCRFRRIDIGTEEQKLPAVPFGLTLDHRPDLCAVIAAARVFHAVGRDDKQGFRRNILAPCVLVDVADVVNCIAECVKESRRAARAVIIFGHRTDITERNAVVKNNTFVVEKDGRYENGTVRFFLLFDHGIEAADGIRFKSCHGAGAVKDKNEFCCRVGMCHDGSPLHQKNMVTDLFDPVTIVYHSF